MPEPLLILGLISAGYVALNSGHRLTPEQKAAYEELKQLYRHVPDGMRYASRSIRYFKKRVDACGKRGEPFVQLFSRLFAEEFTKKKIPRRSSGDAELKRFRKWLDSYKDKIESRHRTFPLFADTIFEMYQQFLANWPDVPENDEPNAIKVPLIETVANLGRAVEQILQPVFHPSAVSSGLFANMRDEITYIQTTHGRPTRFEGRPHALMATYMRKFELDGIFVGTASRTISEKFWYSHALLLAQTRFGKTNIIRWRLAQLLPQIAEGRVSVIVLEPKGVLTNELLRLKIVGEMRDRVVILDPTDTRVSVNIFDKGDGSPHAAEQTIARVERVLNTVTTGLTGFQKDALTFALRAMFCIDEPGSIRLLTKILRFGLQGFRTRDLSEAVKQYFANFKPGDASAIQVVNRLNGLVSDPVFEALFDATHSTFDLFNELQPGKLIVINAKAANKLYARFWIEQVASCIAPRLDLPAAVRTPTTFIIDEAQEFISDDLHFASILDLAAEAKISMLIAAHHMAQITNPTVRDSIYTNTALKFAAQTSADIHALCRSLGMASTDFVTTLDQYEFAHFAPGMKGPIRVRFPLVEFDKMPHMADETYRQMRAANRTKYHYVRATTQQLPQAAPSAPQPRRPPPTRPKSPPTPEPEDDGQNFML